MLVSLFSVLGGMLPDSAILDVLKEWSGREDWKVVDRDDTRGEVIILASHCCTSRVTETIITIRPTV